MRIYFCTRLGKKGPKCLEDLSKEEIMYIYVEVICLSKSLGFNKVKSFHTLECWVWNSNLPLLAMGCVGRLVRQETMTPLVLWGR